MKKKDTYEALRDKGMSKQRAARISNAQAKEDDGRPRQEVREREEELTGAGAGDRVSRVDGDATRKAD